MSVQVSYKKQIGFFLILGLIFIIGVEVMLQVLDLMPEQCHLRESPLFDKFSEHEKQVLCEEYSRMGGDVFYTEAPVRLHNPNQHGKHININSDGWRGDEIEFLNNEYKIFFLGGSTAFGTVSTSDETTISGYLEQKLRDEGFNVKVVNGGIHSATTIDEFYMLENYFLKFDPDMVIMYDGFNDAGDFNLRKFHIPYDEFVKNDAYLNNIPYGAKQNDSSKSTGVIKFFERMNFKIAIGLIILYQNFVNDLSIQEKTNQVITFDEKDTNTDPKTVSFIEEYVTKYWSKSCELGQTNGFTVVNFIQPMLGTSDRLISENEAKIMREGWFRNHYSTYLNEINIDSKQVKFCNYIFDFRNSFSGMDRVDIYFDEGHMTDFGHEIIADKIKEKIVPVIESDFIK